MDEVSIVNKRVIPPKRILNAVKRALFIPETGIKRRDINGRALNFGAVSDKRHLCLERKNAFRLENGRFYGWERFVRLEDFGVKWMSTSVQTEKRTSTLNAWLA